MRGDISLESIGKLVLIVLIVVALLVFIINSFSANASTLNETGSSIIGNLSEKVSDGLTIR